MKPSRLKKFSENEVPLLKDRKLLQLTLVGTF